MTRQEQAIALQKEYDLCDVITSALARVYSTSHWRYSRLLGRMSGIVFALETLFPELHGERVYPLDKAKHEEEIKALCKQYEDEDHERWIREERGQ